MCIRNTDFLNTPIATITHMYLYILVYICNDMYGIHLKHRINLRPITVSLKLSNRESCCWRPTPVEFLLFGSPFIFILAFAIRTGCCFIFGNGHVDKCVELIRTPPMSNTNFFLILFIYFFLVLV